MDFTSAINDLTGDLFGSNQDNRIKRANEAAEKAYNNAQKMSDANRSLFNDYFARAQETYGNYLNALTAKQTAMASEEWDKAYDRYMRDRNQQLQEFSTNANLGQQAYNNKYNKNKDLLGISQNAQDNLMNAYGSNISNLANQNNTDAQNYANWQQQVAANENSRKGLFGRVFG